MFFTIKAEIIESSYNSESHSQDLHESLGMRLHCNPQMKQHSYMHEC